MRMLQGGDISNYMRPFTIDQLDWCSRNWDFVIIGLQDAVKARAFQRQFDFLHKEYYLDRAWRETSFCEPGSLIWCDVETGCMETKQELDGAIKNLAAGGFEVGIYGNTGAGSLPDVIGSNASYAIYPYWYAGYQSTAPDFGTFPPHNGFTRPLMWQWSNKGVPAAEIDCDLNVREATMWLAPGKEIRATDNGFVFVNKGVEVLWLGDAEQPGRISKNFGGTPVYLRGLDDSNQWNADMAAKWSATAGD